MRRSQPWLAFLLLLLPRTATVSSASPPPTSKLCWLESRKLTWSDFQAVTKPTLVEDGILSGALVATTKATAVVYDQLTTTGQYTGSIVSVQFDKHNSWVNKDYFFDRKATMTHEQIHFDIVELTGRKIRRVLARYVPRHVSYHSPETDAEIGCLYDEESDLQLLFDQESKTGDDLKAQARWQSFVRQELAKLREFESTAKDCPVP